MDAVTIGIILLAVVFVCLAYVGAAIAYAHYQIGTFYGNIPPDRFGIVVRGLDPIRVIYNSLKYKLIYDKDCPLGKFVLRTEAGEDLQKLGWMEEWLGLRFIGFPFIHSLLKKKLSWYSVDGTDLIENKDRVVSNFAITKTFGFKPKELALGSDKKPTKGRKDDRKLQRILVNLMYSIQCTVEDVYKAIISTDWMAGTEAMFGRYSQSTLGTMSQDELIADVGRGQLVQNIIANLPEIEKYGVRFDKDRIVYMDYELAGGPAVANRIQEANTKRYEGEQTAVNTRQAEIAKQAGLEEQRKILLQMVKGFIASGMSPEEAGRLARQTLETQGLIGTKVQTYVAGTTGVTAAINTK